LDGLRIAGSATPSWVEPLPEQDALALVADLVGSHERPMERPLCWNGGDLRSGSAALEVAATNSATCRTCPPSSSSPG